MKRKIYSTSKWPVHLYIEYIPYESSGRIRKANITASTLIDALKKIVDKLNLYVDSEDIEKNNMRPEEVIDSIEMSNGDGCDLILLLKDIDNGYIYLEDDYLPEDEEEDW